MAQPDASTPEGAAYVALRRAANERGETVQALIEMYGLEGVLRRLAASDHRDRLVLKGGALLAAYSARRPTRDLDFNTVADPNDDDVETIIREVLAVELEQPDGLVFDISGSLEAREIRDGFGKRVKVRGTLWTAQLHLGIDINTAGDPMWPEPDVVEVPQLLGCDPIPVKAFSRELIVAEKVVTMLERGATNTRWRDFVDVDELLAGGAVRTDVLAQAIASVAQFRGQPLMPLSAATDGLRPGNRWGAWVKRQRLSVDPFDEVLTRIVGAVDALIEDLGT